MKKYLSVLCTFCMLFSMWKLHAAAEVKPEKTSVHLSFETEEDIGNIKQWDITAEQVKKGLHGTDGALSVTTKSVNGGVQWQQYLEPGTLYNASAWIKPLDSVIEKVNLIIITATESEDGTNGSGWEEVPMTAGETTADGYVRYFVENYRVSKYAYPGSNKAPVPKKEGAFSSITVRVPQKNITYLEDEIIMEPVEKYICYEDFDTKVNGISPVFESYDATKDTIRSETYTASLISHPQTKFVSGKDGYAYITGSQTRGAFFENVTLEPLKVYRLTAEITGASSNTSSMVEATVGGFVKLNETKNANILKAGTLISPEKVTIPKGETKQIEYLFRTGTVSSDDYMDTGITVDRIGVCSSSSTYAVWHLNRMMLEEVTELPYGGDMENLSTLTENCENNRGVYGGVYCGAIQTQLFTYGDQYTSLTPVSADGEHGDYLNIAFEGGAAADVGNNRRLSVLLNLAKGESYRLTFRAKVSPTETYPAKKATLLGMYNLGKVDKNGLLSGEEGFDSETAAYGYIRWNDGKLTEEWKEYTTTFTVQNRAKTGYLYVGVDEFHPAEGVVLSLDDIKLENISSNFTDCSLKNENGKLITTATAGENLTNKTYSLYISENGKTFARADQNMNGEFSMKSNYNGKFAKVVLTAKDKTGKTVTAETEVIRTVGYAAFVEQSTYELIANASYQGENDEAVQFTQLLAQYDGEGRMVALKSGVSENNASQVTTDKHPLAVKTKAFLWETMPTLKPVYCSVEAVVKQPGPSIKILGIGNSYTVDSMEYYYQIAKDAGAEDLTLSYLYYGGCTLQQHVEFYESDAMNYTLYRNTAGSWTSEANKTLLNGLTAEDWDIIVIQQQSQKAAVASSFEPYLYDLIEIVQNNKTNPDAKIYWNMTWAYEEGFSNLGSLATQEKMYSCIIDNVENIIVPNEDIAAVIPTGTAIQNARQVLGDTLNRDGTHLSLDTGRYVAALTWVKTTLGLSIDDVSYVPPAYANALTPDVLTKLKKAANDACTYPYSVTK